MKPGGNINYVYFMLCIAILILVIACINFMNLSTARSAERAREVGVRKTMGSFKSQLVLQFLTESLVISVISTVLAVAIVMFVLPPFNNLAGIPLQLSFDPFIALALLTVAIFVGLLAGSYPAFALSSFNAVTVLKGKFTGSAKGAWLRNGLVVFQFFISIVLIVGTMVVYRQMDFMKNKSLGYNKDHVLVIERAFALNPNAQSFLDEIKRIPGVENAAGSFAMLGRQGDFFGAQFLPEGSSEILTTKSMVISDEFAETVGFEFIEGRGYAKEVNDSLNIILNESAVKVLGIADPVGKKISQVQRNQQGTQTVQYTIIGVIKDFNFQSLRDPITPLTIQSNESFGGNIGYAYLRLQGKDIPAVVTNVEAAWKRRVPEQPFKYQFLDENLRAQYESEKRAGQVFALFSILAIIIACIGLFGLSAYTANLRTKEIGVRKVLGASVGSVLLLLSKDFTKLILISLVLAIPLSWYIMEKWLQNFAYRINMGWQVFVFAGLSALIIAWVTVSYQSIKAAIVNPVKSLRSE